jgi:hypothetical protein
MRAHHGCSGVRTLDTCMQPIWERSRRLEGWPWPPHLYRCLGTAPAGGPTPFWLTNVDLIGLLWIAFVSTLLKSSGQQIFPCTPVFRSCLQWQSLGKGYHRHQQNINIDSYEIPDLSISNLSGIPSGNMANDKSNDTDHRRPGRGYDVGKTCWS